MPSHDPYAADSGVKLAPTSGAYFDAHEAEVHTINGVSERVVPAAQAPDDPPTTASGVPKGTSKEVLQWVNGSKSKAVAALGDERSSDQPRKGLIRELEDIVNSD